MKNSDLILTIFHLLIYVEFLKVIKADVGLEPNFPTRVFVAPRTSPDNDKQSYNIGVIQVRLKNWITEKPASIAPLAEPYSNFHESSLTSLQKQQQYPEYEQNSFNKRSNESVETQRVSAISSITNRRKNRKQYESYFSTTDSTDVVDNSDFADNFESRANSTMIWVLKQIELINTPMGYMLLAVIIALIALLALFYAFLTALLNRQNHHHSQSAYKEDDVVIYEQQETLLYPFSRYAAPPRSSSKWRRVPLSSVEEWDSRPSNTPTTEMERIYRSIGGQNSFQPATSQASNEESLLNRGRRRAPPPLEAPPPPPPRVPPPPIPPHYIRRKQNKKASNKNTSDPRDIRLQLYKRQISDNSTTSTRTRTASF